MTEQQRQHDADIKKVIDIITEHTVDDKAFQALTHGVQSGIKGDIKTIKENHLFHIEKDMADIKVDMTDIKVTIARAIVDLDWLKKIFWAGTGVSGAGLLVNLVNMIK